MKNWIVGLLILLIPALQACKNKSEKIQQAQKNMSMYIGTYTQREDHVDGKAEGIYLMNMDMENGHLTLASTAFEMTNPSFLITSDDNKYLYAVSEIVNPEQGIGKVHSFRINEDNSLTHIQELLSDAYAPCHVSMDHQGRFVFVTNYFGGIVKMFLRNEDGSLLESDQVLLTGSGPHPDQDNAHTHSAIVSPNNRFLYIPDKGSDKIWNFIIDAESGKLIPNQQKYVELQAGAGPRHMCFHPNGTLAYVINELDNTINGYQFDPDSGSLTEIQKISTIPAGFGSISYCADIHVHPNGLFLYGSNRGHDSIVAFSIDRVTGVLSLIDYYPSKGEFPRNFTIDPTGQFLYIANQNTDNIVLYNIDQKNGALIDSGDQIEVKTPVCIEFVKSHN